MNSIRWQVGGAGRLLRVNGIYLLKSQDPES